MKQYKVIWFDDEFESLNAIKEQAILNDIELVGFANATDGIEELDKNLLNYDAVVVDGKFYRNRSQTGDAIDENALSDVARCLDKKSDHKKLPWFILSGQISFTKEKNKIVEVFDIKKVYDKTSDSDLALLWLAIKEESNQQIDTQIRHKFQDVFNSCSEIQMGMDAQKMILNILKNIFESKGDFNEELYFTQLRKILESMFRSANRLGLLHDDCVKGGKVNLSESSLFMAGEPTKHLNIKCNKPHFNKIVADSVKSILFLTGAASHTDDVNQNSVINLTEYKKTNNTPYLLYSLTFQLMDILIWFKSYSKAYPNLEYNQSLWETIDEAEVAWVSGKVVKIAENGYGTFKALNKDKAITIIPKTLKEYNLQENQMIQVILKTEGDKTHIVKIRTQ